MNLGKRITELAKAGYSGIVVESHEVRRVRHEIATGVKSMNGWKFLHWDTATGIMNCTSAVCDGQTVPDIIAFCEYARSTDNIGEKTILMADDLHLHLQNPAPMVVHAVRNLLTEFRNTRRVLVGCCVKADIPAELVKDFTVQPLTLPDIAQLRDIAKALVESAHADKESIPVDGWESAAESARGLTCVEAENAFSLSLVREGKLCPSVVQSEKELAVKSGGLVEVVHAPAAIADVGGLEGLKTWLGARRRAFGDDARAYGLPCPKGLLLVGCPGTGKSLVAKATAAELGLPLLRADAGRWFGGLVGESEKNVRSVIEIAEAIAPCVLWIDEIEKGLSGSQSSGSTDGGTSSRVLGTILTWLSEKTSPVFVVATANNVAALPPETLRKGRFDELFFVDLPDASERADIWNIHIQKRRPGSDYDLAKLANMTEGFTGAEIEQTWIEAMYLAFADGAEAPTVEHLEAACGSTVPLSKTASENIAAIRKWADGRARPANSKRKATGKQPDGGRKLAV